MSRRRSGPQTDPSDAFSPAAILFGDLAPRTDVVIDVDAVLTSFRERLEALQATTLRSSPESLNYLAELFSLAGDLDRHPNGPEIKQAVLEQRLDLIEAQATAQRIFSDYQPKLMTAIAVGTMQFIGSVEEIAEMCRSGDLPQTRADVQAAAENMCLAYKGRTGAPRLRTAVSHYLETTLP